ncbi:MAG: tail fiber domain-containing protein, partial [Shewanella sp.]
DGTAAITITAAANGGTSAACSGNAATATKLQTARTIAGVSFDGSANISISAANVGAAAASHTHTSSQVGLGNVPNTVHTTASTVNTVPVRDSAGDIITRLFRSEYANQATIGGAIAFRTNNSTDNYIRFCSDTAAIRNWIGAAPSSHSHSYAPLTGGGTSGTWPIAVTGNAGTVTVNTSASTSFFDMLWASGNTIYKATSSKITCQPSTGDIRTYGHVTFGYTSDIRIKRNLEEFSDPLGAVCQLRTGYYEKQRIIEGSEADENGAYPTEYVKESGFIAQDLEKAVDGLVYESESGLKTIKGGGFEVDALLAGAIKQLKREHDEEISAMKAEMAALKNQVSQLAALVQDTLAQRGN